MYSLRFKSSKKGSSVHCAIDSQFNRPLEKGFIRDNVTSLDFGSSFNQPLKPGDIPTSVTHLKFGVCFNQSLKPGDIPNSVTHLVFGYFFNQPLKPGDIPNSVKYLEFGHNYDRPLNPGDIPDSVTYISCKGCTFLFYLLKPNIISNSVVFININIGWNTKTFFDMFESRVCKRLISEIVSDNCVVKIQNNHDRKSILYNKWNIQNCKYIKDKIRTRIFESSVNYGILSSIPRELLFYLLEYCPGSKSFFGQSKNCKAFFEDTKAIETRSKCIIKGCNNLKYKRNPWSKLHRGKCPYHANKVKLLKIKR